MDVLVDTNVKNYGEWGMDCARGVVDSMPTISPQVRLAAKTFIDQRKEIMRGPRQPRARQIACRAALRNSCRVVDVQTVNPDTADLMDGVKLAKVALDQVFGFVVEAVTLHPDEPLPDIPHAVPQLTEAFLSNPA